MLYYCLFSLLYKALNIIFIYSTINKYYENNKKNVIAGLVIIIIILLAIMLNKPSPKTEVKLIPVKEKIEIIDKEAIKNHTKVTNTKDSFIYVPVTTVDTFNDTIRIPILIESKTFKDTIDTDSSSTTVEVNYEGFMSQINRC